MYVQDVINDFASHLYVFLAPVTKEITPIKHLEQPWFHLDELIMNSNLGLVMVLINNYYPEEILNI